MLYESSTNKVFLEFREGLTGGFTRRADTLDLRLKRQGGLEHTKREKKNISETMSNAWKNQRGKILQRSS